MPEPEVAPMTDEDFDGINDALRNADNPDERAKVEGYAADAYPALYAAYRQERERAERAEGMADHIEKDLWRYMGHKNRADKLAEEVEKAIIFGWVLGPIEKALSAYRAGGGEGK